MITIQKYVRPKSLAEAYELNQSRRSRIIGGMLWLKMGRGSIDTAIDLCDLGLDAIEETDDAFRIGAMVTLRDLELHPGLNEYTACAVRNAVKSIVGVQLRNLATVGGSLWGRFGFSDVLTVFMGMDAQVELFRGGVVPLEQFAQMKPDNDILVRLIVKKTPGRIVYTAMRAQRTDLPLLTCCATDIGGAARVIVGARPGRAMVVRDAEGLLAQGITPQSAAAFALYAAEHVPTGSNSRAGAAYRSRLVRVLVERSMNEMGGAEGWK